jgi:hypothetical protein
MGSGLWVGPKSKAEVTGCTFADNEAYAVEASYEKAQVALKGCTMSGNRKGETDTWKGGRVTVE